MGKRVIVKRLGLVDYKEAWDLQTRLSKEIIDRKVRNRKNKDQPEEVIHYLLICEHPHVYTLGRAGDINHLLLNEQELKDKNATFYKINRGGDITYHGQGQLVVYPILDLDEFFTDIARYIRYIEEIIIRVLNDYGVDAERIDGLSGVWLDKNEKNVRKICAVGVHLSRWTTMHGLAFNINTDLDYFNNIVPCGITDKAVTSLEKELGRGVDMNEVTNKFIRQFSTLFECELDD